MRLGDDYHILWCMEDPSPRSNIHNRNVKVPDAAWASLRAAATMRRVLIHNVLAEILFEAMDRGRIPQINEIDAA